MTPMGSFGGVYDQTLRYPSARRDDSVIDNYHGLLVPDPYRWLEDPDSEETKKFVEDQVELTESVLTKCETRVKLHEKLINFYNFSQYEVPFRADNDAYYFYFHNTGLRCQKVLYIQNISMKNGKAEVLLDPNRLSDDGTTALSLWAVSKDAKYLAYGISKSGSDWVTIQVMRIQDKLVEPHTISWVKFSSICWTQDTKGFFYSRYPAPEVGENLEVGKETHPNLNHELYYHVIGVDQSEDVLCWNDPQNPTHIRSAYVTEDGKYVILYTIENCAPANSLYYCDLTSLPQGIEDYKGKRDLLPFVKLVDNFDAFYDVVSNDDSIFTIRTNKGASRYKLVKVDLKDPTSWSDVIPEHETDVLQSAKAVNINQLVVSYLRDVKHIVQLRDLKTGAFLYHLPLGVGTVYQISARRKFSNFFFGFTSFLVPGIIYECNLRPQVPQVKIFREITIPGIDFTEFKVNQVFARSKDNTKIPMFIMSKIDTKLDGSNPCLLFGYGGCNISLMPYFDASRMVVAKHLSVVICVANIRGGGEYGEKWHKSGALDKKQNCFDDFISTSEYLVSAGYTQPRMLCIEGGSHGGLLVGACITQRPDLFGCALAHAGVMDMLRFHRFTIGHAWTGEFGCSDNEEDFHWLIKYSPLHNIRRPQEHQFPSTMLLTGDHDDRVVPLHSFKMLATMQYTLCTSSDRRLPDNPVIGRIDSKAGHGAGRSTQKLIDEAADRYAFMAKMIGASWVD